MKTFIILMLCTIGTASYAQDSFTGSFLANASVVPGRSVLSPVLKSAQYKGERKPPGVVLKRTGTTLTVLGSIFLTAGIIVAASTDHFTQPSPIVAGATELTDGGAAAITLISNGVGALVTGLILSGSGNRKYRKYQADGALSFKFKGTGGALVYTFNK